MPFTMPNFPVPNMEESSPFLYGATIGQSLTQKGMSFPQELQAKILENQINTAKAKYAMPMAEQDLLKAKLFNQYYGKDIESQIGLRGAETQIDKLKAQYPGLMGNDLSQNIALGMLYKSNPETAQLYQQAVNAELQKQQAMANYYRMGGAGMGVGGKEEMAFQNYVSKDNPQLGNDPSRIYEASNILRNGGSTLNDGTKLNPLSPASIESLNRLTKYGATSPLITQDINAQRAEKEIDTLSNYAMKGLEPYGTTYFNMSPEQVADSFKSDPQSQIRLGRLIASQQLQFDIAQNAIRLQAAHPGVSITDELMKLSQQGINAKYPRLSFEARKEANRYFREALKAGLAARKEVDIGAYQAKQKQAKEISKSVTGERGKKWVRGSDGKLRAE